MNVTVLWRRLDSAGHDACHLQKADVGWELDGMAVFRSERCSACLRYQVTCDSGWQPRRGLVQGWIESQRVDVAIARTEDGHWTLNAVPAPGLEACIDLDFGFTPATNVIPLRRLELTENEAADVPAAWLDVAAGRLVLLPQRYERRSERAYWYQAPSAGYSGLLEVTPEGFTRLYPGLWEMEQ